MKIPSMETGGPSSQDSLETAALLENLGGCCEGTVFTFTSSGPKWRLRQRLNRNKASLLQPFGVLLLREEPAESVFTEMRMMPRSSETNLSDRVELWEPKKWLTSTSTEDQSRGNSMVDYDTTERSQSRIKKLTGQAGGDQRVTIFSQEIVKADNERKELQVLKEDTTPRKSRRYLRCDNLRERQRYGDLAEQEKSWTWNEKKLEQVRTHVSLREASHQGKRPAEERRHKRESCADAIQIFEQRKVKCRREHDSCSTPSKSTQSENLSKADDLKRATYGLNSRQAEEPKPKQREHFAAISASVADESSKSRRGRSIEAAEVIEDKYLNYIPKQRASCEFQNKGGNITEENRSGTTSRPELGSTSTPPVACSFISFKAGVPGAGNKRYHVPGDSSLRARPVFDVEYMATANCDKDETQAQVLDNDRTSLDNSAHTLSISHNRTERIGGLSFQSTRSEIEGGAAQIKTGRAGKPEILDGLTSTRRERARILTSETVMADSSHAVGQEAPRHQKAMCASPESPCPGSLRVMERSFESDGDLVTSSSLIGPRKSSWERTHSGTSITKTATVIEGECGTHRVTVSQLHCRQVRESSRARVSPPRRSGSLDVEYDSEITDTDANDRRANERDSDEKFTSRRGKDRLSSVQIRVESPYDFREGSPDGQYNLQLADVNHSDPPDAPNSNVDDGNGGLEDKLSGEIINDLRKSSLSQLEKQSFIEAETDIPDRKQTTGSRRTSPSGKIRTGKVDSDPLPHKSVPLRRQPWVKSFKRKTGEKVGYFEYWLGRGRKDLSSRKSSRTSPCRAYGPKGVGGLTKANHDFELKLNDEHDESRQFSHSIEQHLIPQAWSKKESQAYVTKEFEILEAVLQSEVTIDDYNSEGAACPQHKSIESSVLVGTVDREEERLRERGSTAAQTDSQVPEVVIMNSVVTHKETDDQLLPVRSSAGQDSPFECREPLDNTPNADCGKQESSHVVGLSNNDTGEAKECRQTAEEREGPLALSQRNSPLDDLNVVSERQSRTPQDLQEYNVFFEESVKTNSKRLIAKDLGTVLQSQDTLPRTSNARGLGLAEESGHSFEKKCTTEEDKLTMMQPFPLLTGIIDNKDKLLDGSDAALRKRNMTCRFGALAAEISGHAEHTSVGRKEKKQYPSVVTSGTMNSSKPVDSLVQIEDLRYDSAETVSSTFIQHLPSPVHESNSSPVMAGCEGKVKSTDVHVSGAIPVANGNGLQESETAANIVNLQCSSPRSTSDIGIDKFPSSVEDPTEKETPEADKIKVSSINRRHKTPIIVRVRNRLTSGWWPQHSLWKRVAKQRMKTGESQVPATKGNSQKERHVDPSCFRPERDSTLDGPTGLHESRTNNAIDTNPTSNQDTELTVTSLPQIHRVFAATRIYQGSLRDPDTARCQLREVDLRNEPSTPEKYEVDEQSQVNRKQAPTGQHSDGEEADCPGEETSVISFAQWQSRAEGFGKSSPYSNKVEANSVADVNNRERHEMQQEKSYKFSDVGGLLSVICLGNSVKEATVLGTFGKFDAGSGIQIVVGEGDEERDSDGSRQLSDFDVCSDVMPAACPSQREQMYAVHPKSSDCRAGEHISNSKAETTKSCYCQTDQLAEFEVSEKNETNVPTKSPGNVSLQNCGPTAAQGLESDVSQESESLQMYLSLNDQNEDLHTCSSTSLDHACQGSPNMAGRMHMSGNTGGYIDEPRHPDGRSDNMCFTPQVGNIRDDISAESRLDESVQPASFECQPCPKTADEEGHRSLSKFVEPFGQARVVAPFCPPLQATNPFGKKLVRGDRHLKPRQLEDLRMSGPQVREMPDNGSPRDLKHLELIDMLKLPSNQQQSLLGHTLKDLRNEDNQERVRRTGQQANACESSYQTDCGGDHGTLCWKDVSTHQNANNLPIEEQVFLERFSAASNNLKSCKLPRRGFSAYCYSGFESLGQPYPPHSPDLSTRRSLLSAPAGLNCEKTSSLSFDRSVEPTSKSPDTQLINPLPACVSKRCSLGEARRPASSQEDKHDCPNTFEPRLYSDYAPSLDGLSSSSSLNRSLDISERHWSTAHTFADCRNKSEHRGGWVQGSDGVHDWRSLASQECFSALTMLHSSFPAQCQSLTLNPRQSSCYGHRSHGSLQCRCDPCNYCCRFCPSALLSCQCPSSINALQRNSECHLPHVPVSFNEHSTSGPHGLDVQCPQDILHPYCSSQLMQPREPSRPSPHGEGRPLLPPERHQFADKNIETRNWQVDGQSKINQASGTDREKGLVWLSEEEMNLIQQLRISREKAVAACRNDAAACIQNNWRKYLEKKTTDLKFGNEQKAKASSLLTEYPMWNDSLQFSELRQAATSLQLCGSSSKESSHELLGEKWYKTMQKAVRIIQRAWRSVLRNRKEKVLTIMKWPKDMKNFYDIVKCRTVTRGRPAPSYESFAKSIERIQAATEGARVRRRLKSHRLQTIIMEIKEIRMLLFEMSQEANCDSTPFLFPQLCTQLRHKILQLHAALNGNQMEARFLLRRCPATPLKMHSSRSTSPKQIYMVPSQKSMNEAFAKLSAAALGARKTYSPPLTNSTSVIRNIGVANNVPLATRPAFPAGKKLNHTQSSVPLTQTSKGNVLQLQDLSPDPPDSSDLPDSAKLLQWYFSAQRSPSVKVRGQGTSTFNSGHEANVKQVTENSGPSQKKSDLRFPSRKASPKLKDPEYPSNKSFDDQPLPVPQRRKIPELSIEEMVVGGGSASMYLTEYAPNTEFSDKPKRPFLKRKSIAMPSQKLDWSKVKPMVSSRLEPELKTKLSLCKGSTKEPTKEPTKTNSKKKKANYNNVKSRLFSYEENVSPTNSGDGTCLRSHTAEASIASYPFTLRSLAKGSSVQGTESSRNSRVLASRQRAASPDLMHLRCMAGANRHCPETSMLETQNPATYSSHFNSARYLHKLGNSDQTSNGTLIGERTQRIRLRILPRSTENQVGDLFVQEEMQEIWEDQSIPSDEKGKRQQSHSHRYAIYQEQDPMYSGRAGENAGPDCAKDDRTFTTTSSNKVAEPPVK